MKNSKQYFKNTRSILLLALFALVFITNNTFAQNINNLRFWGSSNGLFNKITHAIVKDKTGYLWLGTQNGLIRFDGRSFVDINEMRPNAELAGSKINCLLIVNDSTLWAGTDNGLFNINLYTFFTYKICLPSYINKCSETFRIESLLKTSNQSILIGSESGLMWLVDKQKYEIIPNPFSNDKLFENVNKFTETDDKMIWFNAGQNKIYSFNLITKKITDKHEYKEDIYCVKYVPKIGLLVNNVDGLYVYDKKNNQLSSTLTKGVKNLYDIVIENENSFWITHFIQGLYLYNNNKLINLSHIFNIVGESNSRVTCIYKDGANIWIGTNYGLIKFTNSPSSISHVLSSETNGKYSSGISARAVCELADKSLLFGTYNGIYKSKPPYKTFSIIIPKEKFKVFPYTFCVEKDIVWIGTEGTGLVKFNPNNNNFEWISKHAKPDVEPRFITAITNDTINKRLLLGTYLGLIIYNKDSNTFSRFSLNTHEKRYDQTTINKILKADSTYWFATNLGLFITNSKLKKLPTPSKIIALNHINISSIYHDTLTNTFWIGTLGKGLWRYDANTNKTTRYNREQGLSNDNIASIIYQSKNSILVGTYNGLCKINPNTGSISNLFTENGLSHNEFNLKAAFKTSEGLIFMGGLNGYNIIDSDIDKYKNLTKSNIYITKLYTLNGSIPTTTYYTANNTTVSLPPNNKAFDLEFGISDYTQTENNIYSYKLIGKDNDWNYIGNRNYLRFSDLAPGKYKLLIKATSASGNWLSTSFTINLIVNGYFYKTWWFILLIFMAILSVIIGFYRFKLNQLKKLANLRLQISSDLHDEVGSILTAVGMQAEMLRTDDKSNNQLAFNKIAETSRKAVSNMRDVVWSIDSRNDKYSDLIDRMHEYIALVIDSDNIDCIFEKTVDNENMQLDLVIRQNLYLIFKESLNNIVKHANATKINIHLKLNNKVLYLSIENNGECTNNMGHGMGIKNMEMRAHKMKAKLTIEKENRYKLTLIKLF